MPRFVALAAIMVAATWPVAGAIAQSQDPQAAQATAPQPDGPAPASPISSQEVPVAPADPITVSGTRTEKNQYDVPASISVVRKETIERRQPQQLDDLLRDLPGVDVGGGPRPGAGEPVVRGLGGERVLIRLDGARQDFSSGHKGRIFVDPDLLKQVDVVRGPNSVLYGSGAIGGVIALTTRDASDFLAPGQDFGFRLKGGYQSVNNMWLGQGAAYGRYGGFDGLGALTWRTAGNYRMGGDAGKLPYSGMDIVDGLFKAGYTFAPGQRLSTSLSVFHNADLSTTIPNENSPDARPVDRTTRQITSSTTYEHRDPLRPWIDLRTTFYYNNVNIRESRTDIARTDDTRLGTTGFDAANTSRFEATSWASVAFTYGVEGRIETAEGERNGLPRPQYPDGKGNVFGGFAQPEITVYDKFKILPGLRYDHYYRSPDNPAVGPDLSEGHVSPRIGVQYDALPWLAVYALYSQAFRAPSLSELYVSGSHFPGNNFIPNPDLKPETAYGKEVGIRLKFDDAFQTGDQLRLRGSFFYTNYKNFIEEIVLPTTTTLVNLSRAHIAGIEVEGSYASNNWFGTLGAALLRGRNEDTGQPIASIPAAKLALTVGYQIPTWDLVFGGRTKLVAAQDRVPAGVPDTDGYVLFDLFLSWQPSQGVFEGGRVDVGVDNLTNKLYRDNLSANYDPGRNFKLAVSKRF